MRVETRLAVSGPAREETGGFQSHVNTQIAPRKVAGISFSTDPDRLAVDDEVIPTDLDIAVKRP